jgi:hypothetical protein
MYMSSWLKQTKLLYTGGTVCRRSGARQRMAGAVSVTVSVAVKLLYAGGIVCRQSGARHIWQVRFPLQFPLQYVPKYRD